MWRGSWRESGGCAGVADDTPVSGGIRPERIPLGHADDDDLVRGANQFSGIIEGAIHMGAENHYRINTTAGPVMVVRPNSGERLFATGDPIRIGFCAEDCMVYPSAFVR